MGDLRLALEPYLDSYDVITFPDGALDSLFTAGQLTVFRNIDYFRKFFQVVVRSAVASRVCADGAGAVT
jgi:hypothetical protein